MKVRFMDLRITEEEKPQLMACMERVLEHGYFINGEELSRFEEEFAKFHGRKYGIGVCSGTGSLYYSLRALGIGSGDEVITTSLSWIATANAIASTGATPVFADINEDLNIDVESIEPLITPRTKAILPVHYAGRVCAIERILEIANKHNLFVVEDASQAIGAKKNGALAGSFG
ncbi:MAG: aminotransferase class I/II-fold pyridoxal phosphate-dependent enzyme, partial [Helicobacter sp.]|nr:aminotransferase class I/II-fold pyridoxal phosphate-dependent enzyme [Helicobacter sp.]